MKSRNRVPILITLIVLLSSLLFGGSTIAQQSSFQSPILVVNTSFLNVRSGPGVEFSVVTTVVGGTELPVLGVAPDGVWYQVNTDNGVGWVNVTFTLPRGSFGAVGVVNYEEDTVDENLGQGGGGGGMPSMIATGRRVTGFSLVGKNIMSEPTHDSIPVNTGVPTDLSIVYPLRGTTTNAAGEQWYLVNVPGIGSGWTDNVQLRLLECGMDEVVVTRFDVPIKFDGISTQDSYILSGGTEAYLQGFAGAGNTLVRIELPDGTVGLVPADSVAARQNVRSICTGVAANNTNLGQGGGGDATDNDTNVAVTGNRVVVNTGNLNIRSGPGAGFAVVATVPGGTTLAVDGRAPDGVWYLVSGSFGRGWLNSEFVLFRGNYGAVPVITETVIGAASDDVASNNQTTVVTGNRVVVNTGNLNIRSGPGAGFAVVATVPGGTTLAVDGRAPDGVWYLVSGSFGRGWLNSEFVLFRGNYGAVPVITETIIIDNSTAGNAGQGGGASTTASARTVTGYSLVGKNIMSQPSHNSIAVNTSVPTDLSVIYPLQGTITVDGAVWYLVDVPGIGRGWSDGVELRVLGCGRDVYVTQFDAPIKFDGISTQDSYILSGGTEGYFLGFAGVANEFARFELIDGTIGLLPVDSIAPRTGVRSICTGVGVSTSTPTTDVGQSGGGEVTPNVSNASVTGNRVVVNTGNLNIRSGPNAAFAVVATVPGGTILPVVGRSDDGVWYVVEGSFGRGWLNSEFVLFRGNYGSVPVIDN